MKRTRSDSTNKLERKTIEKNRRIRMKSLSFKLVSIIPDRHFSQPKEFLSQQDQIDEAAAYIKILTERIEALNRRKAQLINHGTKTDYVARTSSKPPILTVRELGHGVEVVLISGLSKNFLLSQVISIIEQEAAQVLTINVSRVGDSIIHTLHAQVKICRVGVDISRISDRIHEIISSNL
ncbi:transcription factor bHLH168-like [Salvia hispanica]|uniref:transcription factor bHLH168-like n=1 Tax=Salvia hispanica TaxID=49212 RepID=UPI0020099D25|nr:transcription factor bHLH168-like [Salvia hispanica]